MRTILLVLLFGSTLTWANDLQPLPFTTSDHVIPAGSATGERLLAGKEFMVRAPGPNGKLTNGDLLVLFDRPTGLVYWLYWSGRSDEEFPGIAQYLTSAARFYVTSEKLVVFLSNYQNLGIMESGRHASSLDEAVSKTLQEVAVLLEGTGRSYLGEALNAQDVPLPFPRDFFVDPRSSGPSISRLISATHNGHAWEILVEARQRGRVTLDEKYKIVSSETIPREAPKE